MFYKINDKYYVLVGNKYIEVKFTIENGDVQATPVNGTYIERSQNVNAMPQPFDEDFKKKLMEKPKGFGSSKSNSQSTSFKDRI